MGSFKAEEEEEVMIFSSSTFFSPVCAKMYRLQMSFETQKRCSHEKHVTISYLVKSKHVLSRPTA